MIYYNILIACFIAISYLLLVYFFNKTKKVTTIQKLIHLITSIYISFLVKIMIFPIEIRNHSFGLSNNFIPLLAIFKNISDKSYSKIYLSIVFPNMILGNLIPFIPIGVLFPILIKNSIDKKKLFFITLLVSGSKEIIQLVISTAIGFNYKSFDINSILLSIIGFSIGYAFSQFFVKKMADAI